MGDISAGVSFDEVKRDDDGRAYLVPVAREREALANAAPDMMRERAGVLGSAYYGSTVGGDGSRWPRGMSNSGSSPIFDHQLLLRNNRAVYHGSAPAKALVDRSVDTIIDTGLMVEPAPNAEALGLTDDQVDEFTRKAAAAYDTWASKKTASRDELLTHYQQQRFAMRSQFRDGEYFARFHYERRRRDLFNPLQISFVDPTQIHGYALTSTGFPLASNDGIIKDDAGREIGYKIYIRRGDQIESVTVPAKTARGDRLMVHGFNPEYVAQTRGIGRLSYGLNDFESLGDFSAAQIQKAINQSIFNMYVKPSPSADASDPIEAITRMSGIYDDASPPTDAQIAAADSLLGIESYLEYNQMPEATFSQPGGAGVFNLKKGEDLRPFPETSPSENYSGFVDSFTAYLSAAASMPIEVLLMRFNANYSASRAALILYWRIAQIWRAELISDFLNPTYEAVLNGEIAAGRISAPGWSDPWLRAAWLGCTWYGAPMPNIDPEKTAKADKLDAEIGATDLDRIARNRNGSIGRVNRTKLAKQFAELTPAPWLPAAAAGPNDVEKDDPNDGGGDDG